MSPVEEKSIEILYLTGFEVFCCNLNHFSGCWSNWANHLALDVKAMQVCKIPLQHFFKVFNFPSQQLLRLLAITIQYWKWGPRLESNMQVLSQGYIVLVLASVCSELEVKSLRSMVTHIVQTLHGFDWGPKRFNLSANTDFRRQLRLRIWLH